MKIDDKLVCKACGAFKADESGGHVPDNEPQGPAEQAEPILTSSGTQAESRGPVDTHEHAAHDVTYAEIQERRSLIRISLFETEDDILAE